MGLKRSSGIILHPTSLPGPDGIGDLGPEAYRWIDFLADSGCSLWQVLPPGTHRLW
jgi:4-alpha-glucanotransferase